MEETTPVIAGDTDENIDNLSEEEVDTLLPNRRNKPMIQSVSPIRSKQMSFVYKLLLVLCPYFFGILFFVVLALYYFVVLYAPVVTVLNALPNTKSVLIDLKEISLALKVNDKVTIKDTTFQYAVSNYLLVLPSIGINLCPLDLYSCESNVEPNFQMYTINDTYNNNNGKCVAYLSGTYSNASLPGTISLIGIVPQIYDGNNFIGIKFNQEDTQGFYPCNLYPISNETGDKHEVPSGLYLVFGSVNISLPQYNKNACQRIDYSAPISHNSKLLIESENLSLSSCGIVISYHQSDPVKNIFISCFISVLLIFLFLITCDLSNCAVKRFFNKNRE